MVEEKAQLSNEENHEAKGLRVLGVFFFFFLNFFLETLEGRLHSACCGLFKTF